MTLRDHILALVAPAGLGDEVIAGARLVGASTELGPRLTFDVDGQDVHIEIEPVNPNRPSAARSRHLMFSYRSGSGGIHVDPGLGLALCRAIAEVAGKREDDVLLRLAQEAASARQERVGPTKVREVRVTRLLEPAGPRERRYFTLSPYVGCLIGCRFCYAQSRTGIVRQLEGLPDVPWGSYVDVRVNAPEVLRSELEELPLAPLKFCPIVSDPYHAVEQRYELTRRCLEAIRDAPRPYPTFVLTRSQLLERDVELLASLSDGRGGVSIPTADDDVRRHFEPRGASIAKRLRLLSLLRDAGVRTFAVVQPMLPGSVSELADALAAHVSSVSIDVLHGVEGAEADFSAPEYARARQPEWQEARALELEDALIARGVAVWHGELPPDVKGTRT